MNPVRGAPNVPVRCEGRVDPAREIAGLEARDELESAEKMRRRIAAAAEPRDHGDDRRRPR
jgi:hypothetical protein